MSVSRLLPSSAPANAAVTSIAQAVISGTLLTANVLRQGAIIHNHSRDVLYVKLGSGASLVDFSFPLPAHATVDLPFPVYTGIITGIWAAAGAGSAKVTETS